MECENRKLVADIQQRLDTSSFDQYCTKSVLLEQYKVCNISVVLKLLEVY